MTRTFCSFLLAWNDRHVLQLTSLCEKSDQIGSILQALGLKPMGHKACSGVVVLRHTKPVDVNGGFSIRLMEILIGGDDGVDRVLVDR